MPGNMTSVTLRPGVNLEPTAALNEAGISDSQLIRTKNGLTQTMGGWQQYGMTISSTVRDIHCWQDTLGNQFAATGAVSNLVVQTSTFYRDITPQTRISNINVPAAIVSSGSDVVGYGDSISGVSIFDSVEFVTPISIGNLLLQGSYQIATVTSTFAWTIISSVASSTSIVGGGALPVFTTTANSNIVNVLQPNHTAAAIVGLQQTFLVPTSVGDLTIEGSYSVYKVVDADNYQIITPTAASSADVQTMNGGLVELRYYVTGGIVVAPTGFGGGGYGSGGYGGYTPTSDPGTPIVGNDWTLDNWGEILLACPEDGPVYRWTASDGIIIARLIPEAPLKNGGIFVSMPQQILVCWKSVQSQGNGGFNPGGTQDNLIVRWSDAQDFTNFDVSNLTVAGSFHIPTGSIIRGGLQAPNFGVVWTDIDCWIMQFVDATTAFNFTKAGSGCGLIGKHAAGVIAGQVMWLSEQNFFQLGGVGVEPIPCTVWDFVFQNLNQALDANGVPYKRRACAAPNSAFSEMAWFFPTPDSTENNAFVKFNIIDNTWDKGLLTRTAWEDVSVIGPPMATDTGTILWQHEQGNMISGAGNSYFKTGWWAISDGEELAFVDFIMPDFTWGTYGNTDASVQITFFSVDYPGETPRAYGPFTVTRANQYITPRIRGRLVSMAVQSSSNNVFWRLGRIRFRYAVSGKR